MGRIDVATLGWLEDEMTLGAVKKLRTARKIILRTGRCGAADWLCKEGIAFETCDALYDETDDFDELIDLIADRVTTASEEGDVLYGVCDPGDETVHALLERAPEKTALNGGVSEGSVLEAYAGGSLRQINALDYESFAPDASVATLVREIDSPILAGEMKLKLMEAYPEEEEIIVSLPDGTLKRLPLCEMDWLDEKSFDHRTCALIPAETDLTRKSRFSFDDLNRIMRRLRAVDGCPWDIEQTHESLRASMIEEAWEAVDAIDRGDTDALYDELGDVLLMVAFHAEIGRQHGEFDVSDVTTAICRKMIERHPHVFGDLHCETGEDTVGLWEQIKMKEKNIGTEADALRNVTRSLPSLMRAQKVQKKAALFGAAEEPDSEKLVRLAEALNGEASEEAVGRLLFETVRHAAKGHVDPEHALSVEMERFIEGFEQNKKSAGQK